MIRRLRAVATLLVLVAVFTGLAVLPIGPPGTPGPQHLTEHLRWLAFAADPASAAMSMVRLIAMGAAFYLLACGSTLVLTDFATPRFRRAAVLFPASMRRLIGPLFGVATLLPGPHLAVATPSAGAAGWTDLDPPAATLEYLGPELPPTATLRWLGSGGSSGPLIAEWPDTATGEEPAPTPRPHPPMLDLADEAGHWLVQPGDHFWSIAEATVDTAPGSPTLTEHWLDLIALNRDRLPDPNNADLIRPGMRLRLR